MISVPDFFIIGAPKCGTTSLCAYLQSHPSIFVPTRKEPYFFADDIVPRPWRVSADEYSDLYAPAANTKRLTCDGSTWYLRSATAAPRILELNPAARFIVMLRNQVDIALSLHAQALYDHNETISSFEKAWKAQNARRLGRQIPKSCGNPLALQYGWLAKVGEQVSNLFQHADRGQVLVLYYDEFKNDPQRSYSTALRFLEVDDDKRHNFPVHNSRRVYKNGLFARFEYAARNPPPPIRYVKGKTKKVLGVNSLGIHKLAQQINKSVNIKTTPSACPPSVRSLLLDYFADDRRLLESVLQTELTNWRA